MRRYIAQGVSLTIHGLLAIALLLLMNHAAAGIDPNVQPLDTKHLVYLVSPGPGGGGGGNPTPAPRVAMEIPASRPAAVVPVAVVAPLDPLPPISVPIVTNAAMVLTASGTVDGSVRAPVGGGGKGNGIGVGNGDGVGPGDGTGIGGGRAGEGGISWPDRIREVKPLYTTDATRLKIQGTVDIEAVIGIDGKIISARVTRSLDSRYGLDRAAIDAVLATPMLPCKQAGKPVVCKAPFSMTFSLR